MQFQPPFLLEPWLLAFGHRQKPFLLEKPRVKLFHNLTITTKPLFFTTKPLKITTKSKTFDPRTLITGFWPPPKAFSVEETSRYALP